MSNVEFNFRGKTLILTGAAGGIGRAVARQFSAAGANLVLADLELAPLTALTEELSGGGGVVSLAYDASRPGGAAELVAAARDEYGGIDFLVPAAGLYPHSRIEDISDEEVVRVLQINLASQFELLREATPAMRDGGSLTAFASIAASIGSYEHASYAASKAAIIAFVRSVAREWGPTLRANAVSPGTIETPMAQEEIVARGERIRQDTPLGRFGRPDEVASVVAFLSSDGASFLTGLNVHINGGLYMGG